MKDLISIIIPAYNVEHYLKKCVESVENQTWDNIEIVLIDDGSTDSTGEICDILKEQYNNIVVVHQSNKGLSAARNAGIDCCKGEWVAFLDSDDWVDPEMYECLYKTAIENKVSISSCLSRDIVDGNPVNVEEDGCTYVLTHAEIIKGLLYGKKMRFEVWNKLWKRELIETIRFIPGQVAEDVHFDRIAFEKAKTIAHINKAFHNYLISRPGNTNSSFKIARLCIFEEFRQWKRSLEEKNEQSLANTIAAVAANFAVDIYGNAVIAKQPSSVVNELREHFVNFYCCARKAKMPIKRKAKLALFRIDPRIWMLFVRVRNII